MPKHPILTIHTATYNRAHTLPKVYQSLKSQTCYDFEWFVTDNGSTDGTAELFNKWKDENPPFRILYHRISERGIPRALNYGVNHINGKYFFMLDSDDILLSNGVELIYKGIDQIEAIDDIAGVGFVRIKENGEPIKGVWPKVNDKGFIDCTNLERSKYDLDADMCEAYKVSILKKYPFRAEDGYKIRWFRDAIYVCEYLEDGQTQGNWNLLRNNKMGYAMLSNMGMITRKGLLSKYRAAAQHIALSIVAGNPEYILKSNKPWLTILALPFGIILSFRRREQFKWDDPISRRNFD